MCQYRFHQKKDYAVVFETRFDDTIHYYFSSRAESKQVLRQRIADMLGPVARRVRILTPKQMQLVAQASGEWVGYDLNGERERKLWDKDGEPHYSAAQRNLCMCDTRASMM
jgi:hypothetical protein